MLDGMFTFVLLDESVTPSRVIAARDPIGITTLYQGWSSQHPSRVYFASELKALVADCDKIISFPPGHIYDSAGGGTTERYYNPGWWDADKIPTTPANLKLIRETLEDAVRKRLMSEVPYGVLLSGGLDSSVIAAIAARETEKVALAQQEERQRRLLTSGNTTPTAGVVNEAGEDSLTYKAPSHPAFSQSDTRILATAAFLLYWDSKLSRLVSRTQGCCVSRYRPPRVYIHRPRRSGRYPRRYLSPRDI